MIENTTRRLSDTVDEIIRDLVTAEHFQAGSVVSMPVPYPSGATVVLEIFMQREKYFVSDRGGAAQEADLMGASRNFSREATSIAQEFGIRFDGHNMFVAEAPLTSLSGAMIMVSHCSQMAASRIALKHAERAEREMKDVLFTRLRELYVSRDVVKDAEFRGASSHKWKVAVLVTDRPRTAAFETVANHYNSVTSATTKFGDISRLETPPKRFAVVRSVEALADYIGVIGPTASRIVELGSSDETYQKLMAA